MITLKMEFRKLKRKKIGLTMAALMGIQFLWFLWGTRDPSENEKARGWVTLLYTLPLDNVLMMPTFLAVLASRLSDLEHKGSAYKQLRTLRRPCTLYRTKVLCGLFYIVLMVAAQMLFLLLLGYTHAYAGQPDPHYYMLTFFLTLACCSSLYLLQLNLSLQFFNQMVPLVAGLCGSLIGLLLMFVKMYSYLPWGGFLSSALVAMDWNPDTRDMIYYYREYSAIELGAVGMIFVWIIIFYTAGKALFVRKEL